VIRIASRRSTRSASAVGCVQRRSQITFGGGPSVVARSVKTERPEISISLSEMAKDSWVVFELPGFADATSGKQQDSLDALRQATETSYFKGPDAVWVKLVIPTAPQGIGMDQFGPSDTEASITVRR